MLHSFAIFTFLPIQNNSAELAARTMVQRRNITTLCAQPQTKKNFESVAKQRFQNFSCGCFDQQLLGTSTIDSTLRG